MSKIFHIVSNKEWGGGEQYVYDLCQRQKADGIDVSVFCKPVDVIIRKYRELADEVHPLKLNGVSDLPSAWRMSRIIKAAGRCVIHAHNFKDAFTACYARRLSGNKEVRVVMCRHLTRKGKNGLHYRWLYQELDALCFDSDISKSIFLSTQPIIDGQKLSIVHTSIVVPAVVESAPIRQELSIAEDEVLAMYHGRLDPEKGIDTLIEATAMLKDKHFRLVLIGHGSEAYTRHIEKQIADNGLRQKVILAGFRHPVLPYVAAADFGILASTVREGCPLSPQEYMSQGLPVVVTNNGGQREYVVNGTNGLLVAPGDARQLADAMERLIDHPSERETMGRRARVDFRDHMDYEYFYKQIKQLYGAYLG